MSSLRHAVTAATRHSIKLARRWAGDRSGASLVQFVLVVPILVLVVLALYAVFAAYAARSNLCTAVWEAARYLQVEGPMLQQQGQPDPYPTEWQKIAFSIINSELKSSTMAPMQVQDLNDVAINPPIARRSNKEMFEITPENVQQDWFFVRATVSISNPMGFLIEGLGNGGQLKLTCQGTGFFESQPIGPTPGAGAGGGQTICRGLMRCTDGPPPTDDPNPPPSPTCPPCR